MVQINPRIEQQVCQRTSAVNNTAETSMEKDPKKLSLNELIEQLCDGTITFDEFKEALEQNFGAKNVKEEECKDMNNSSDYRKITFQVDDKMFTVKIPNKKTNASESNNEKNQYSLNIEQNNMYSEHIEGSLTLIEGYETEEDAKKNADLLVRGYLIAYAKAKLAELLGDKINEGTAKELENYGKNEAIDKSMEEAIEDVEKDASELISQDALRGDYEPMAANAPASNIDIETLQKKYGLSIHINNITISNINVTVKLDETTGKYKIVEFSADIIIDLSYSFEKGKLDKEADTKLDDDGTLRKYDEESGFWNKLEGKPGDKYIGNDGTIYEYTEDDKWVDMADGKAVGSVCSVNGKKYKLQANGKWELVLPIPITSRGLLPSIQQGFINRNMLLLRMTTTPYSDSTTPRRS